MRSGLLYRAMVTGLHVMGALIAFLLVTGLSIAGGLPMSTGRPILFVLLFALFFCGFLYWISALALTFSGMLRKRKLVDRQGQMVFTGMFFTDLMHPFSWWRR
ncbi:hypothetical protein Lfu02_43990 [Longispora fulva]|uniref:Kef-type K+ transport system membrane component KefB n=1 Tax=Longispora fulva TaxID=619741 RepID=A0A8J7GFJ6_9ACTN|nr:hypothetical protein [Longispora fulva]MBG6136856.1 Kef-type K+ transport system membrane component KefB [Longispora fulva]GIG60027.1 hypothetical protein Lfu02_43990 [Longispora fulva]